MIRVKKCYSKTRIKKKLLYVKEDLAKNYLGWNVLTPSLLRSSRANFHSRNTLLSLYILYVFDVLNNYFNFTFLAYLYCPN